MNCPCGSTKKYSDCCEPFHKKSVDPDSPEKLMRSRYSAFAMKLYEYLRATTDPQTFQNFDFNSQDEWANTAKFTQLEVLNSSQDKNKGIVEFKAHYTINGSDHIHHEVSKFRKQAGQWFYREGKILSTTEN